MFERLFLATPGSPVRAILLWIGICTFAHEARAGDSVVSLPPAVGAAARDVFAPIDNSGAAWLSATYDPNLVVGAWTTISLVAVDTKAPPATSLGYFTYELDGRGRLQVKSSQIIYRNLDSQSTSALTPGTTVTLLNAVGQARLFSPGERVGFFLEPARANNIPSTLATWAGRSGPLDPTQSPTFSPATFTTLAAFNPEARALGAEGARHAGMLWMPALPGFAQERPFLLVGFENSLRAAGQDSDFADLVFAVLEGTVGALSETKALKLDGGDVDGDGINGVFDSFPADHERAFMTHMPQAGRATLALEDGYPDIGDLDYNDALISIEWTTVSDARGRVRDLLATLHLLGSNPRVDHRMGLRLPVLPADVMGTIWVERIWGTPERHEVQVRSIEEARTQFDDCLPAPFPSTSAMSATNATSSTLDSGVTFLRQVAACARVKVTFKDGLDPAWLAAMPLEPYFVVRRGDQDCDVHLPGSRALSVRAGGLPTEGGARSFLSRAGYPYVLFLPQAWQAPAEGVPAWEPYPGFRTWVGSRGALEADWYKRLSANEPRLWPVTATMAERAWRVRLQSD